MLELSIRIYRYIDIVVAYVSSWGLLADCELSRAENPLLNHSSFIMLSVLLHIAHQSLRLGSNPITVIKSHPYGYYIITARTHTCAHALIHTDIHILIVHIHKSINILNIIYLMSTLRGIFKRQEMKFNTLSISAPELHGATAA